MKIYYLVIWILCYLSPIILNAQHTYIIRPFFDSQKAWGNQNWAIDAKLDDAIYVANNKGLLQIKSESELLYPHPEGTNIRSVLVYDDRIYTGSFEDMGYWQTSANNALKYYSLKPLLVNTELTNGDDLINTSDLTISF